MSEPRSARYFGQDSARLVARAIGVGIHRLAAAFGVLPPAQRIAQRVLDRLGRDG